MDLFLMIVGVIAIVYGFYSLYDMPKQILKEMKLEIDKQIIQQDRNYEENKKMKREMKKWLF